MASRKAQPKPAPAPKRTLAAKPAPAPVKRPAKAQAPAQAAPAPREDAALAARRKAIQAAVKAAGPDAPYWFSGEGKRPACSVVITSRAGRGPTLRVRPVDGGEDFEARRDMLTAPWGGTAADELV